MEKQILNVTHYTAVTKVNKTHKGQFNDKPSLTVEGLSEPMDTIIKRFQRGQTVLGTKIYYDSEVNQDFETQMPFKESEYDLTDIDKARQDVQRIKEETEAEKRRKAKAQKLIDDEKLADEVLARRQKKEQNAPEENEQVLQD